MSVTNHEKFIIYDIMHYKLYRIKYGLNITFDANVGVSYVLQRSTHHNGLID